MSKRKTPLIGLPRVYSSLEQEVAILYAVWGMIDGMVNYQNFVKFEDPRGVPMLNSSVHQRLLSILLVDFLSKPEPRNGEPTPFGLQRPPSKGRASDSTYLFYLRQICANPQMGTGVAELANATEAFSSWLEGNATVPDVWLPPLDRTIDLTVQRLLYLKICGNVSKHNFSRLQGDVQKIQKLLRDNGKRIKEEQAYQLLPPFTEWFYDHVLNYHVPAIAEFLNNIRWEIYDYLGPRFARSFVSRGEGDQTTYGYLVPSKITRAAPRAMFWDLMNMRLRPPYFPRFTVDPIYKQRY